MKFAALILSLLLPLQAFAQVGTTQIQTDTVVIGKPTNVNKTIQFKKGSSGPQPAIRYGQSVGALEFSNDGSTFEVFGSGVPAGAVMAFATPTCPSGWLVADGGEESRAGDPALFAAIGTIHGNGDGSTTFNKPLLQGVFIRGATLTSASSRDQNRNSRGAPIDGTFSVTGASTSIASPTITVPDTSVLGIGQAVTGTNIPAGSYVRSIDSATTFRIGNQANSGYVNATGTGSGITLTVGKSASGNYVGSTQGHAFQGHSHGVVDAGHSHTVGTTATKSNGNADGTYLAGGASQYGGTNPMTGAIANTASTGISIQNASASGTYSDPSANETRPVNIALLYCIKR